MHECRQGWVDALTSKAACDVLTFMLTAMVRFLCPCGVMSKCFVCSVSCHWPVGADVTGCLGQAHAHRLLAALGSYFCALAHGSICCNIRWIHNGKYCVPASVDIESY